MGAIPTKLTKEKKTESHRVFSPLTNRNKMASGDKLDMDASIKDDSPMVIDEPSPIENLSQDCLTHIFSYLPVLDKVRCMAVSRGWNDTITGLLSRQKALGSRPTFFHRIDYCEDRVHRVYQVDVVPAKMLRDKNILEKILQKCHDLKSLAILDNDGSNDIVDAQNVAVGQDEAGQLVEREMEVGGGDASSPPVVRLVLQQPLPGIGRVNPVAGNSRPPERIHLAELEYCFEGGRVFRARTGHPGHRSYSPPARRRARQGNEPVHHERRYLGPAGARYQQLGDFEGDEEEEVYLRHREYYPEMEHLLEELSANLREYWRSLPPEFEGRRIVFARFAREMLFRRHCALGIRSMRITTPEEVLLEEPNLEEDFLVFIAKQCKSLECLDVSGYKTDFPPSSWKKAAEFWKDSLTHLKVFQATESTIPVILRSFPKLVDLSVRVGIGSSNAMNVSGLQRLTCNGQSSEESNVLQCATMKHLQVLYFISPERQIIKSISNNFPNLRHLSLVLPLAIKPENLFCLAKLTNLKELHIKRRLAIGEAPEYWSLSFLHSLKLNTIAFINILMKTDDLVQLLRSQNQLQYFTFNSNEVIDISPINDRILRVLRDLEAKQIVIEYPNAFTEDNVIDLIVRCRSLRLLKIHKCQELIPIKEIGLMAQKHAMSLKTQRLIIDIACVEQLYINATFHGLSKSLLFPRNLQLTMSTAADFVSTHMESRKEYRMGQDDEFGELQLYMPYL